VRSGAGWGHLGVTDVALAKLRLRNGRDVVRMADDTKGSSRRYILETGASSSAALNASGTRGMGRVSLGVRRHGNGRKRGKEEAESEVLVCAPGKNIHIKKKNPVLIFFVPRGGN